MDLMLVKDEKNNNISIITKDNIYNIKHVFLTPDYKFLNIKYLNNKNEKYEFLNEEIEAMKKSENIGFMPNDDEVFILKFKKTIMTENSLNKFNI